jgi:hypothetical protein
MEVDYRILRALVPAAHSSRGFTIGSRRQSAAVLALDRLQLSSTPTTSSDRQLLDTSRRLNDPEALLCLRCHVSQAIEQKLLALMRRFGRSHQLDLIDMAATVLDDPGPPIVPSPWRCCAAFSRKWRLHGLGPLTDGQVRRLQRPHGDDQRHHPGFHHPAAGRTAPRR